MQIKKQQEKSKNSNKKLTLPAFLLVNKPLGKTPLESIQLIKTTYPHYKNIRIGYAGRLDPMAEGLLMLLVGEENKKKQQYEKLSKTYSIDVLFGISTDTYDTLGIITHTSSLADSFDPDINAIIPSLVGPQKQPYPPYSSGRVAGKPLFYWARKNALESIAIPNRDITIHSLSVTKYFSLQKKELHSLINSRIQLVSGDFRQPDILRTWKEFFSTTSAISFPIVRLEVICSHGTYMRSLANRIGEKLQTGALALSITRTMVGEYKVQDAVTI